MTLVNTETGELITQADVRASVARVIAYAESIWVEWAWQVENRTWSLLGYESWDAMRAGEYGALNSITAPRAERPELVARFRGAGLTQAETARTLGVGQKTVSRYDEPRQVHPQRSSQLTTSLDRDAEVVDAELVEDDEAHTETPSLPAPRRAPLPDQARAAGWELRKAVERLQRIADDDRFTANKEQVTPQLRSHLTNAVEVCQDLLDRLN